MVLPGLGSWLGRPLSLSFPDITGRRYCLLPMLVMRTGRRVWEALSPVPGPWGLLSTGSCWDGHGDSHCPPPPVVQGTRLPQPGLALTDQGPGVFSVTPNAGSPAGHTACIHLPRWDFLPPADTAWPVAASA